MLHQLARPREQPRPLLDILHVVQPTSGGVATLVRRLLRYQVELSLNVGVAAPSELLRDLPAAVTKLEWRATRSPRRALHELNAAYSILRTVPSRTLHLHSAKAGLWRLLRPSRRVVYQPHGWATNLPGASGRIASVVERAALRWTDSVIAVSPDEALIASALGAVSTTVEIVQNGVDFEAFAPAFEQRRARVDAQMNEQRSIQVVCIGRVCHAKGQDELLLNWHRVVRPHGIATHLTLVGENELGLSCSDPTVTFAGHRPDIALALAEADLVVLPSRYEGHSLALLEAMAVGVPVIAFDVSGVSESLGKAGAVVERGDWDGLSREFGQFIQFRSDWETKARAERPRIRAEFSEANTLSRLTDIALRR